LEPAHLTGSDGLDENERMVRGLVNLNDSAKASLRRSDLRLDHGELLETFTPSFFCMASPFCFRAEALGSTTTDTGHLDALRKARTRQRWMRHVWT
jgi:hypothetical protein